MIINSVDLNTVPKDSFPVFAAGDYFVKVKEMKTETSKTGSPLLKTTLTIVGAKGFDADELPKHDGGTVKNSGFNLFHQVSLVPNEKGTYTQEMINRTLADIYRALGGTSGQLDTESAPGKYLKVKVRYKAAKDSYNEGNEVSRFFPITEEDGFNQPV